MLIIGFIIAQFILLIVIIVVLKRLIFSDTNSAINRLTKIDTQNREKERILTKKLEETQKFIEEQKNMVKDQGDKAKQESRRAAAQLHADIIHKAKSEADEIIRKAQASKEQVKADAMIEAEANTIDLCADLLNEVFSASIQITLNDKLIEEFIGELEKADLAKVSTNINEIELFSARGISDNYLLQIKNVLQGKIKRAVKVVTKEEPQLVGGVMMKIGTMVVDGSLAERFKECAGTLKEKLAWKHAVK